MWKRSLEEWEQSLTRDQKRSQGSIWTPPVLATTMSKWLLETEPSCVFDPAAGSGNLLAPFDIPVHASEQDALLAKVLRQRFGIEVGEDFWLDQNTYPAITANPPYISHSKIKNKKELHEKLLSQGIALPKNTNLALLFYAECWHKLEPNGRMIFLMPTEFMQTKSGEKFKRWLLTTGVKLIVDLEDSGLFGQEVVSTACLVLAEKDDRLGPIGFYQAKSIDFEWSEVFKQARFYERGELDPAKRWRQNRSSSKQTENQTLDSIANVYPGTITGANDFFLINQKQADQKGLVNLRYCLLRPQNFKIKQFHDIKQKDHHKNNLLVDIKTPDSRETEYLEEGINKGFSERPTMKTRDPWFKQETPILWDFVVGNFRRTDYLLTLAVSDDIPTRVSWAAIPNRICLKPDHQDKALALFGWLSSETGQAALRSNERHAGNGLYTLRSGALKQTPIPLMQKHTEEMTDLVMEWIKKPTDQKIIEQINSLAKKM